MRKFIPMSFIDSNVNSWVGDTMMKASFWIDLHPEIQGSMV